ncbi:hypothetical protein Q3C01_36690 [Bradyrhizobium sp. UFLA05-109]
MAIAQYSAMPSLVRSYDGLIILGYVVFSAIALVAIYFAAGGPSFNAAALSLMDVMP